MFFWPPSNQQQLAATPRRSFCSLLRAVTEQLIGRPIRRFWICLPPRPQALPRPSALGRGICWKIPDECGANPAADDSEKTSQNLRRSAHRPPSRRRYLGPVAAPPPSEAPNVTAVPTWGHYHANEASRDAQVLAASRPWLSCSVGSSRAAGWSIPAALRHGPDPRPVQPDRQRALFNWPCNGSLRALDRGRAAAGGRLPQPSAVLCNAQAALAKA